MLLLNFFILLSYFADLRKFRTYKGCHVRDLLRAMRNKVTLETYENHQAGFCMRLVHKPVAEDEILQSFEGVALPILVDCRSTKGGARMT